MRGKVLGKDAFAVIDDHSPAHAGKRRSFTVFTFDSEDHPRICGEKLLVSEISVVRSGSPPHMRGKETTPRFYGSSPRITPAYAGKSFLACVPGQLLWDHPRICGEKLLCLGCNLVNIGSPPHMRGKSADLAQAITPRRITPAYAGKSRLGRIFVS